MANSNGDTTLRLYSSKVLAVDLTLYLVSGPNGYLICWSGFRGEPKQVTTYNGIIRECPEFWPLGVVFTMGDA